MLHPSSESRAGFPWARAWCCICRAGFHAQSAGMADLRPVQRSTEIKGPPKLSNPNGHSTTCCFEHGQAVTGSSESEDPAVHQSRCQRVTTDLESPILEAIVAECPSKHFRSRWGQKHLRLEKENVGSLSSHSGYSGLGLLKIHQMGPFHWTLFSVTKISPGKFWSSWGPNQNLRV